MKLNLSSVKRIWKKFKQTQDVKDRPRTGRKSATTRREDKMIVRMVKCNRRITSLQVARQFSASTRNSISRRTVINRLLRAKYCSRRARKGPMLTAFQSIWCLRVGNGSCKLDSCWLEQSNIQWWKVGFALYQRVFNMSDDSQEKNIIQAVWEGQQSMMEE